MKVSELKKNFNTLCGPSKFYLVISSISILLYLSQMGSKHYTPMGLFYNILIMSIYTYILNWVCSLKYGVKVSWFLVFLPVLFMFGLFFLATSILHKLNLTKEDLKELSECDCDDK
jgi:hypothetical protein